MINVWVAWASAACPWLFPQGAPFFANGEGWGMDMMPGSQCVAGQRQAESYRNNL